MDWIIISFDSFSVIRLTLFFLIGPLLFLLEYKKIFQLQYSKFRGKGSFSSRKGMLLIYGLPILSYLYIYFQAGMPVDAYHLIMLFLVCGHFLKRVLEVLFLHKFSATVGLLSVLIITYFYSAAAQTISQAINLQIKPLEEWSMSLLLPTIIGMIVYLSGQTINFYHHRLLAGLRRDTIGGYRIPQGGFFHHAICPHYFGELLAWLGIAIAGRFAEFYLIFWIMFCYLLARSINTHRWYREKFSDFPDKRKFLIPFLL